MDLSVKKQHLFFGIVILVFLAHILTFQYPYFYEDEALYLLYGLNETASADAGFIWQWIVKVSMALLSEENIKLFPLLFGFGSGIIFYLILSKGFNLRKSLSLGVTVLYLFSPIFFSQAHRIRPEIVHVFLALGAFLCLIYSCKYYKKNKKSFNLNYYLFAGIALIILIPHTHIMALNHFPALGVLLLYVLYKHYKSLKTLGMIISIIGAIFVSGILLFIPNILSINPNIHGTVQTSGFFELIQASWGMFKTSFVVWYGQVPFHSEIPAIKNFYSYGHHLLREGLLLYIGSIILGTYALFAKFFKNKKKIDLEWIIIFAAVANCIFYFVSIYIFKRINNSYNIALLPWMLIAISGVYTLHANHIHRFMKWGVSILGVFLFLGIYMVHYYANIYTIRHNNFNIIVQEIKKDLAKHQCYDVPFASTPYNVFLMKSYRIPTSYEGVITHNSKKINASGFTGKLMDNFKKGTCIVVHARHHYGFDFFKQFSDSGEILREILKENFQIISKISMPFYTASFSRFDPFYPIIQDNGWMKYPMGADTIYYGGQETVWILRQTKEISYKKYIVK